MKFAKSQDRIGSRNPLKQLSVLLALLMLFASGCSSSSVAPASAPLTGQIIILHTNDIHGHALYDPGVSVGYAMLAQYKKSLEAQGAAVLLLDAGDASQGTALVNLSFGKSAFELMNEVGYDAMVPGNHEFDWGSDNFLQNVEIANFPILSANIVDRVSRERIFEPYKIFEKGGKKIGVFGLTTPETLTKTHPDKIRAIDILQGEELFKCAQEQIDALKKAGCDYIICLGHLGVAAESAGNQSIDVIKHTTGINLFIDGHSHTVIPNGQMENSTLLVSTGKHFESIGVVVYDGKNTAASLYNPVDSGVYAKSEEIRASVDAELNKVFATTQFNLDGERAPGVRTQETNLGDFAADAILWQAKASTGDEVDGAITNGGGIRVSIPKGEITMAKMKEVFPFANTVCVIDLKGSELLEALEAATFATPAPIGAFPQVAGIEFTINTSVAYEQAELYPDSTYYKPANPGSRITITSINGAPYDSEKIYRIATNDFMAAGGDTYYSFSYAGDTARNDTYCSLEDALVNYTTEALGGVIGAPYDKPQGRITIK